MYNMILTRIINVIIIIILLVNNYRRNKLSSSTSYFLYIHIYIIYARVKYIWF